MRTYRLIPLLIVSIFLLSQETFGQTESVKKRIQAEKEKSSLFLKSEEKDLLAGADARIEKHRMATATLRVLGPDGKPVSDAGVVIEQTQHEFLFGANHPNNVWPVLIPGSSRTQMDKRTRVRLSKIDDGQIEALKKRFLEFANYTSLPVWWPFYEGVKGEINYKGYDQGIDWLHDNGIKILAHSLVWNSNTPKWVPNDCKQISSAVEKRVTEFMSHYNEKIDYYLIFNEPANPERPIFLKDKMTKCFSEVGKAPFVAMPFNVARKIQPNAKLMINEVTIVSPKFPELLGKLIDSGGRPLYDVIGLQTHMHESVWPLESLWKVCEFYSSFKVPLHFTELTVLSGTPVSGKSFGKETTTEGERFQAEYVTNLYTLLFSHPSVGAIQWWNLSDILAWKDAPAGLVRKDMTPKPAYTALMDLIRKKWWTRTQTTTAAQGQCEFKGFFGKYRITITPRDGKPKTYDINLNKEGRRDFQLVL